MKTKSARAFTLLELLMVVSISILIIAFAVPAFNSIIRGSQLTNGAQILLNELTFARQTALTKNRTVEVRFYRFTSPDKSSASDTKKYRAIQSFEVDETGKATPVGKIQWLPNPIIIDSSNILSPLLDSSLAKNWSTQDPQIALPRIGMSYDTCAFKFQPNGSTDLNPIGQRWFVTLHNGNEGDALSQLPNNFYTIQIDALNGRVQGYRP